MNEDNVKGNLQKIGGRIEEAAGALVGDHELKDAGRDDQLKGTAREAWGNIKDVGNALADKVKATKYDAEAKASETGTVEREPVLVDHEKI